MSCESIPAFGKQGPAKPSLDFDLDRHDVHLWRFSLSRSRESVAQLERTLSPDERRRADRFHAAQDARRFIVARGVLRSLLGRYTQLDPGSLEFCYGRAGKPELPAPSSGDRLRFNVAHSGSFALVAVARGHRVGVDLEALRAVPELDRIARRYFSARENHELTALPPGERRAAFFRGWTQKEAFVKAIGDGLHHPIDQIEVSVAPPERTTKVTIAGAGASSSWVLRPVHAGIGYAAALAVEAGYHEVRLALHGPGTRCIAGRPVTMHDEVCG